MLKKMMNEVFFVILHYGMLYQHVDPTFHRDFAPKGYIVPTGGTNIFYQLVVPTCINLLYQLVGEEINFAVGVNSALCSSRFVRLSATRWYKLVQQDGTTSWYKMLV